MKIKNSPADKWFALAVKEGLKWTCQCCGKMSPNSEHGFIDLAHNFSRRHRLIRWRVENATALCRGCHMRMTQDPDEHVAFFKKLKGEDYYTMRTLRNSLQKVSKKDEALVAAHYKSEYKRLQSILEKCLPDNAEAIL